MGLVAPVLFVRMIASDAAGGQGMTQVIVVFG